MSGSCYGYAGKILHVDLTTLKIYTETTDVYVPRFLGGRGINQWTLLKELRPWVTPFEPANIICIGAGTLTGTVVPGAARLSIDSKNAFNNGIGSGSAGGWFASELKFAGFDNVIIRGKARKPAYLWIDDDRIILKSADALWGKTTAETEAMIKEEVGNPDIQVLCIGPAGENMARQACIIVSGCRAVGRCGLGAIMGSKNLKAIAVKGTGGISVKHEDMFMEKVLSVSKRLCNLEGSQKRRQFGTLCGSPLYNNLSSLCYKNFEDDHIPEDKFDSISHEVFHDHFEMDRYACIACPTACGHVYSIKSGHYAGTKCLKAEANTVWDFGGKLAIDDVSALLKAQEECCQLGLDIDNTSSVIGWAIDCFRNRIISEEDTEGLKLTWGDHGVVIELIRRIAHRKGFGNILAEGALRASHLIERGSDKYVFHTKGQELIEAIRTMKGWALGVVVSARGGSHTRGALGSESRQYTQEESHRIFGVKTAGIARTYEGKPRAVVHVEYTNVLLDSLGICLFTGNWIDPYGINPKELAQFYSLATGIKTSTEEIMQAGERIFNIEKMFNVLHAGFTRKDDFPPMRLMEEPVKSGPFKGEVLDHKRWNIMLDEYYDLHGWDRETGWPTKTKLHDLGLDEFIKQLERVKGVCDKLGGVT